MVRRTCSIGLSSNHNLFKAYKSIIRKWFRSKKSSFSSRKPPIVVEPKHNSEQQGGFEEEDKQKREERSMNGIHSFRYNEDPFRGNDPTSASSSPRLYRHQSADNSFPSTASSTMDASSRRRSPTPTSSHQSRSKSMRKSNESCHSHSSSKSAEILRTSSPLPTTPSRRGTTPIMFSNSSGMLKPPPILKKLECTLEELCYGCKKNINITREVLTDTGGIVVEEEMLKIKVKPGWKQGTTIKFEGKGSERPGAYREDVVFFISEQRHHLFRREGDDLELEIEIPLVKALTGCTIPVPLLGGQEMDLTVEDIIYPGYEKIIPGQGMPISKDPQKRGNLKIKFLVEFPTQLTQDQRSEVVSILRDSC
ncbi:hypothetical protein L6164_030460 [Bauhinia variegata]|uniref:Uncharacterized protein n=1 Tax=Bauhinia variegata TaxID=167791 RepID=A0ACB9LCC2_BAUVA|nr:hypothetical protein L6164_030460 [Bauhinia variegata]